MNSFTHEGKTYNPNMTRAGVRAAEEQGLSASQMAEKPFTALTLLFFASLFSGYKLNLNKAAGILDDMLDSGEVQFESLFEELAESYTDLFGLSESESTEVEAY